MGQWPARMQVVYTRSTARLSYTSKEAARFQMPPQTRKPLHQLHPKAECDLGRDRDSRRKKYICKRTEQKNKKNKKNTRNEK